MKKCQDELMTKESELQHLSTDVSVKTSQLRCMDEDLQHMKNQLDSKSDIGMMCTSVISLCRTLYCMLVSFILNFCRDTRTCYV